MSSVLSCLFRNFGKGVQKLGSHETQIRQKSIKAAVLKDFKNPLIVDDIKPSKVKNNQVIIIIFLAEKILQSIKKL